MKLHVVLYQPDIAQNAGNVARTCAAVGAELHLVHPLGFYLSDRHMRRAGLDYWPLVKVHEHASWAHLLAACSGARFWLTSGGRGRRYTDVAYRDGDLLVLGPESRGLPPELLAAHPEAVVHIPMRPGIRSLNVANAGALVLYEAVRQRGPEWW